MFCFKSLQSTKRLVHYDQLRALVFLALMFGCNAWQSTFHLIPNVLDELQLMPNSANHFLMDLPLAF